MGVGPLDDVLRQTETARDRKGVGLARHADQQPVGGPQSLHVELTAGILHPLSGHSVELQLGVMGRCAHLHAQRAALLNDGLGQRRTLHRVGAGPQLVVECQRPVIRLVQDIHHIGHMGGEGGKGLLDGLLVADIGQHLGEHGKIAVVPHRDMQAALGHCDQQSGGLQRHRLAAGVGPGDHQGVELLAQANVNGHRLLLIQQRMPGPAEPEGAVALQPGRHTIQPVGQLAPGKDFIQSHQIVVVLEDGLPHSGALGRQGAENALDLLLLLRQQLPQLVVGLHRPHGFDEVGGAGGGHIVHQTGDHGAVLRLDGHHESVRADGDNGLLQIFAGLRADELLQHLPGLARGGADMAADIRQCGAGRIGDLLLREDRTGNAVLQRPIRRQCPEQRAQAVALLRAVAVGTHGAGGTQHRRNVQQFPIVERAAQLRPL